MGIAGEKQSTMAEAPADMFDPSLKKKKKKKKPQAEEEADAPAAEEAGLDLSGDAAPSEGFDPKKKKKKKKGGAPAAGGDDDEEDESFGTFNGGMKKKKKKKEDVAPEEDAEEATPGMSMGGASMGGAAMGDEAKKDDGKPKINHPDMGAAWNGSDREYTYEELLGRIYTFLNRSNPDISSRKAFKMKPPQVFREGTKKVVLVNFPEICQSMNRQPEHVLSFMLAELGTSGSLDAT